jgi:MoxR-like ATPase
MTKRVIDLSMAFSSLDYEREPGSKEIENADAKLLSQLDPPLESVEKELYFIDDKLQSAVNLAIALNRPLLLQGEPGCGKTRLAYAVAYGLGLPLEVNYIKSTSRAQDLLYTYDAVNRLYDAQMSKEKSQQVENYIRLAPLGRAIARAQYGRRSVVLIDEIDKADLDFPNDLLWELDRLEFQVTEAPEMKYTVGKDNPAPIIIVTHNEEKALPAAFLRRCIFHYIEFPQTRLRLQEILTTQGFTLDVLIDKAIDIILRMRNLDLSKKPGLSELLDWVGYLEATQTPVEELENLPHLGALLKRESDRIRVLKEWQVPPAEITKQ